jgi:predicted DNA-binding protein YlxM (UPF0122 family)
MTTRNLDLEESLKSRAFILTDEQIKALCKKVQLGHTLAAIAQSFGISRATLANIIRRDPKVAKAYGEAREAYFKPALEWYESLFNKKKISEVDPHLLMRAFEFKMKSRAAWGVDPNLDSLGDEETTIIRTITDPIETRERLIFLEEHAEELKKRIEEAKRKTNE